MPSVFQGLARTRPDIGPRRIEQRPQRLTVALAMADGGEVDCEVTPDHGLQGLKVGLHGLVVLL
jgi:hypothetical protein